jgi:hypothetical protein
MGQATCDTAAEQVRFEVISSSFGHTMTTRGEPRAGMGSDEPVPAGRSRQEPALHLLSA